MDLSVIYEKHAPTTATDHVVVVKYIFVGSSEEIKKVEDICKECIGSMLTFKNIDINNCEGVLNERIRIN